MDNSLCPDGILILPGLDRAGREPANFGDCHLSVTACAKFYLELSLLLLQADRIFFDRDHIPVAQHIDHAFLFLSGKAFRSISEYPLFPMGKFCIGTKCVVL
jgi:hypothetical protein